LLVVDVLARQAVVFDMEITELMRGGATPFAVTSSLLLKFGANQTARRARSLCGHAPLSFAQFIKQSGKTGQANSMSSG
jgi:hypothetical protein